MQSAEIAAEIERLKATFPGADENRTEALKAMLEQAAHETIFLRRLNEQALLTGLVKIHPEFPDIQKPLPISTSITQHSAALTNILDKLVKHLGTQTDDEDDELAEFE